MNVYMYTCMHVYVDTPIASLGLKIATKRSLLQKKDVGGRYRSLRPTIPYRLRERRFRRAFRSSGGSWLSDVDLPDGKTVSPIFLLCAICFSNCAMVGRHSMHGDIPRQSCRHRHGCRA